MHYTQFPLIFWTELIAFDVNAPDLGMEAYFICTGIVPEKMLLFLWSNDFVHNFDPGLEDGAFIRDDCCSYGGHLNGDIHQRQRWTRQNLKQLIALLHRRGIKVYLSFFDQIMTPQWAERNELENMPPQWVDSHREILIVDNHGTVLDNICPLKRLKNGSLYEDFLIEKLIDTLNYFDFDGYHGGDGYIHPRLEIFRGDFSSDMLEQFNDFSKGQYSELLKLSPNEASEKIWKELRLEWIRFQNRRQAGFWYKVGNALSAAGKGLVVNSIWTRDPFEASYRYGFDYRCLRDIALDGIVVESVSTVLELEGWHDPDMDPVYKATVAAHRLKAIIPNVKLYFMNAVMDIEEQFFPVRHAPARLESEILWENSNFIVRSDGGLSGVFSGITCCLAYGMCEWEWNFLRERWQVAMALAYDTSSVTGTAVVFSESALDRELESYCSERIFSSHRLHSALTAEGAALPLMVRIEDIASCKYPLVVLHPRFFPDDELRALQKYRGGEVIYIGTGAMALPEMLYPYRMEEPDSWVFELPEPMYDSKFIAEQAEKINLAAGMIDFSSPGCWVKQSDRMNNLYGTKVVIASGKCNELDYCLLRNNQLHYQVVTFKLPSGRCPKSMIDRVIVFFNASTSTVTVKLPPCGAILMEF